MLFVDVLQAEATPCFSADVDDCFYLQIEITTAETQSHAPQHMIKY